MMDILLLPVLIVVPEVKLRRRAGLPQACL
jgi:hypothetical protein